MNKSNLLLQLGSKKYLHILIRVSIVSLLLFVGLFLYNSSAKAGNNSPGSSAGYTFCAYEGQRCNFNGTGNVMYGANGKFTIKYGVSGGINCNNNKFGDPNYGVRKACFVKVSNGGGNSSASTPAGYTFCAYEGQRCSFNGLKDVAYGANGKFTTKYGVSGGINCNNNKFGDPNYGVRKACFIKASNDGGFGGIMCSESGEGVYVYEDSNFSGRCSKFTGNSSNPRGWEIGNDRASSIRIVGRWIAILYEHDDFQGASSMFILNDPNLGDNTIGNDHASSIQVYR